jgi:geranylgeranyl diphosphate synthase type II
LKKKIEKIQKLVDRYLSAALPAKNRRPRVIYDAVRYSVFAGGKRIRPVLLLLAARACGLRTADALPAAAALEMIHTYSLIHDDLPAMDDDDFRRGKPSSHKKFGEANAILAGDALLTKAFEVFMLCAQSKRIKPENTVKAAAMLAKAAGIDGMAGGQAADMFFEGRKISKEQLLFIHSRKTGALIKSAVTIPAVLAGKPSRITALWARFGEKIGLAFQVSDDILDATATSVRLGKTAGKDARKHKATYPLLFGLAESRKIARKLSLEAGKILCKINEDTKALKWLADYVTDRAY